MNNFMQQIMQQIIHKCKEEIDKDEKDSTLKKDIINPLIRYMGRKMMPYIWFSIFVLFLLMICICFGSICLYNRMYINKKMN